MENPRSKFGNCDHDEDCFCKTVRCKVAVQVVKDVVTQNLIKAWIRISGSGLYATKDDIARHIIGLGSCGR